MSSISNNSVKSVGEYISRLKAIRDAESKRIYNFWDNYIKEAQAPGATVESITLMLDINNIQISNFTQKTEHVYKSHFPKNLETVEEYQYWIEEYRGRQKVNSSSWYRWSELVKIANEKGATVDSIRVAMDKKNRRKGNRKNTEMEGVESSGKAANPSTATVAASSSEVNLSGSPNPGASTHVVKSQTTVPKKDVDPRQNVAPGAHGGHRLAMTQVPVGVSSGSHSIYTRSPPQTSTTKAIAAPVNKPQSKLPVPVTNTTSHSRSHPQSRSRSSSISSARQQHRAVTSDVQRPKTPVRTTASASATTPPSVSRSQSRTPTHTRTSNPRASPRKIVPSPITFQTPRRASTSPGPWLVSPSWPVSRSPLNSPKKRKLSLSSEGASTPNRSSQSKQPSQVQAVPPAEDTWDLGMFLEEETQGFDSLRNEFERSNSFYDPFQKQ
ncbi:hypothetical protein PNOK_0779400 [Pyrrhoderma noxium]|uniref:Uncharacterized protein n=1 Tax=Pyrrhoderma noxium TaxID=2282107 RepID=A0A286U9I1_9AGAM|nr:hypothetical protein PNOK_0779400 [Pyrrhoderma noxium]